MDPLYFAYGSNLSQARMAARVPSARALGSACLSGFRLTLDKRRADGSGKANLRAAQDERVYGAVYQISAVHWEALDACEPGYRRMSAAVMATGSPLEVWTYISGDLTPDPVAFEWYKRLIVAGAAEHALPRSWQQWLQTLPARPDAAR
jgi:gamma-glutamylcyclotransferase (GGCT)/AIG2-like uncharacterized protein YtfP